jgi:DNA repair exonuclease SbcCD ATPase subunit
MQIKMQAMEKEVAKARKALETATTGPAQQIEELTKETKDLKMKAKKLESELEVALNRAAANEEAQKQKLELRAELEEMREAKNKGKDMTEEVKKTPTYKLEKLEKENAELKDKLAAHMSGSSTPVGSPMVKRAVQKPSPANSPRSSEAAEAESVKIKELEEKVAEQAKKITELEANVKESATPRKLVGSGLQSELQQELNEAQLQIAKKDRELSQLQSQLQETTLQLSRAGMNTGGGGAGPAKGPAKAPHKAPMKKMFLKKKMGPKTPVAPKKAP